MLGQIVSFTVAGLSATAVNYIVFSSLAWSGLHYLAAAVIGWSLSVTTSYVLNKRLTFASGAWFAPRELGRFIMGSLLQLGLGLTGYAVLIGDLGLPLNLAFLFNLVLTSSFSWLFMRLWVFASTHSLAGPGLAEGPAAADGFDHYSAAP